MEYLHCCAKQIEQKFSNSVMHPPETSIGVNQTTIRVQNLLNQGIRLLCSLSNPFGALFLRGRQSH